MNDNSKASTASLRLVRTPVFQGSRKDTFMTTDKKHVRLSLNYQTWYTIGISSGEYLKLMVEANVLFSLYFVYKEQEVAH